jgi:hypothetical protein
LRLFPGFPRIATEKGRRVMLETIGIALKKEVNVPTSRLIDYTLFREVQREMGR